MTTPLWWQLNAGWASQLAWVIVSGVGLLLASRRRRQHPKAFTWAVAGFAVMLLPGFGILLSLCSDRLPQIPFVFFHTLGFALLTVAIFTRRSAKLYDP